MTDPDARLVRKTHHSAAFLGYQASVLTENRHGLIVQPDVRAPGHHAERDAALEMLTLLEPRRGRRTLGADKGYNTPDFITASALCVARGNYRGDLVFVLAPELEKARLTASLEMRCT